MQRHKALPFCIAAMMTLGLHCSALGSVLNLTTLGPNLGTSTSTTVDGIVVTIAIPPGSLGFLNASGSAFGVNQFNDDDNPLLIDGGALRDSIGISFDRDVYLDSLATSQFDAVDAGRALISFDTQWTLTSGVNDLGGQLLTTSNWLYVSWDGPLGPGENRGFSLDSVTFRAVPEPSTLLIGSALVVGSLTRRKR